MKLQVCNRAQYDENLFVRLHPTNVAKLFEEALSKASYAEADTDSWNVYQEDPKNILFLPLCISSHSHDIYCSYNGGFIPEGTWHSFFF